MIATQSKFKNQPPPSPTIKLSQSAGSFSSKLAGSKNNKLAIISTTSNSGSHNDVGDQKQTISNPLVRHSLDQKANTLSREVPHSTPEVDANNGTVHHLSGDCSNDQYGNSTIKHNVISSKLQILDGEKLCYMDMYFRFNQERHQSMI